MMIITLPTIGTGKGDDSRRPALPEGVGFTLLHDHGDTMTVQTDRDVLDWAVEQGYPLPPAERIEWLKRQLRETDYVGLADYDKDQPELKAQRQAWREEIRQLKGQAKININTATAEQLETLSGVSQARAQAIIDGRPWSSVDDLATIQGISAEMIAAWDIEV